jgi:hypothetical protein
MDFARVEAEYRRLKAQFERGALTEAALKAQLEELMIEDEQGRWWIVGYETGQWYVHDGEKWVQQEPPRAAPGPAAARPPYPQATEWIPDARSRPAAATPSKRTPGQGLGRDRVSILLITAGWLVCFVSIGLIGRQYYHTPWGYMAVAGGIGGLITGLVLRRTEPPTPWKQVAVVTLGWIISWAIPGLLSLSIGIGSVAAGLIGPGITALALRWAHPSLQWKQVALVTLGWTIGWVIGWAIGAVLPGYNPYLLIFKYALHGGTGAAIGSWAMFRQLRAALPPGGSQPSAAR